MPAKAKAAADVSEEEALRLALKVAPAARFEMHGAVKPVVGPVIRSPDLKANYLQRLESDIVTWCLMNDVPIRIVRLKPRRKGSSTWSIWKLYCLACDSPVNACIIGGAHYQSAKLFAILKTYAENESFDPKLKCAVLSDEAKWSNGSTCDRITAANTAAGRSATYQAIVATEVAYWAEEGVSDAASVLSGLLKTVTNAPRTMIDVESTANGTGGAFWQMWQDAITFEELQAGRQGFVRVFAPWFKFDDSRRDPKLEELEEQCIPPDKEAELRRQHGLDDWQVAWMQWACRVECKKDFDVFCEEYPFDPESAFRTSGRRRFNIGNLEKMKDRARQHAPAFGVLEPQADGSLTKVVWRGCPSDEARVLRWEQPQIGAKYLLSADTMTGETQVGGKDPDNHAVGVIRAGMFQSGVGWVPPKLVARMVHDFGEWERNKKHALRWDIDVLEEQVWRLSQYYGNCLIVPEMNADRGLVELLKLRPGGPQIYVRKLFNQREQRETNALGWYTDPKTRELVIENLARAIREQGKQGEGVEIYCPITLKELSDFVVKLNGRSEAMTGSHDDTVLQCLGKGTLIRTINGPVPIEEILVGDRVLTHSGNYQKVTNIASRWADDVLKVRCTGKPELIITPEHPVLAAQAVRTYKPKTQGMIRSYSQSRFQPVSNVGKEWGLTSIAPKIEIDVLQIDLLETAPSTFVDRDGWMEARTYSGTRKNPKQNQVKRFIPVDASFCRMIGFYLADGCCGGHNVSFALHLSQTGIRQWLLGYFASLGLRPSFIRTSENGGVVTLGSVLLNRWLRQFSKRREKAFPSWVESLPREKQRWVLQGYLLGDGCLRGGLASAVTISRKAAWQLWEMAIRNRLEASLLYRNSLKAWGLEIGRPAAERLKSGIPSEMLVGKISGGNPGKSDQTRMKWSGDYLCGRIRSIEKAPAQRVWNIEVDHDESYTANGYVVHNCAIGLMCLNAATTMVPPKVEVKLPPEIARLERESGRAESGVAMRW